VHHLREGFEFSPIKATPISVNYHTWWLAEKTDGPLLGERHAHRLLFPGGAASGHVGQEIDVQVNAPLTPHSCSGGGLRAHVHRASSSSRPRLGRPTASPT
jgi:hypothetical protein